MNETIEKETQENIIIDENFNLFETLLENNNVDYAYHFYRLLREYDPVFIMKSTIGLFPVDMCILTGYSDINKVLQSRKFGRGTKLEMKYDTSFKKNRKLSSLMQVKQNFVTFLDPPEHTRMKGFLNKSFNPKSVSQLKPKISSISNYLIDEFESKKEFNVIDDFAYPLAAITVAELLGVSDSDRHLFKKVAYEMIKILDGVSMSMNTEEIEAMYKTAEEIKEYFENIYKEKLINPKDDLMSRLIHGDVDGDKLTELEVVSTCVLLLMDAHEITKNLTGNGIYALLKNPEQFEMLKNNPELIENAVEEFLRYDSPAQFTGRKAHEDFVIGDKTIKKGTQVVCMIGAGNRDPLVYKDPDTLDITRQDIKPLSFGAGIHYCAGASLSRLQGQVAVNALLERIPDIRLKNKENHYIKTLHGRGFENLVLEF